MDMFKDEVALKKGNNLFHRLIVISTLLSLLKQYVDPHFFWLFNTFLTTSLLIIFLRKLKINPLYFSVKMRSHSTTHLIIKKDIP